MKTKVDPEVPVVRVNVKSPKSLNGGLKSLRKNRKTSGQFTVSSTDRKYQHRTPNGAPPEQDTLSWLAGTDLQKNQNSTVDKKPRNRSQFDGSSATIVRSNSTRKAVSKWKNFAATKRQRIHKLKLFEKENLEKLCGFDFGQLRSLNDTCFGFLDAAVEEDGAEAKINNDSQSLRRKTSHSRALLHYFISLTRTKDEGKDIDLDLAEQLLKAGADVNCGDKYGQTVLHEVARVWHPDVAKFLLDYGAKVDIADNYGRTPLHVAAAVDYPEMVEFLLSQGANIHARTSGEYQTAIHYAAKNDACNSLNTLLAKDASMEDRDFKGRTPLQVAAELDRSETCKVLLDAGATAGVWDESGMSAMALMIIKMPPVALKALDQFHIKDRANRKQYFYLNLLETPIIKKDNYAKSCLKVAVEKKQFAILMHPVMQRLVETKWNWFAKMRASYQLVLNIFFCVTWTILLCTLPKDFRNLYSPMPKMSYRIFLEIIVTFALFYWIISEAMEYRNSMRERDRYVTWRENEMTRDIQYCHPRWPEERAYIERELADLEEQRPSYFVDWWNYFDWLTYTCIVATMAAHLATLIKRNNNVYTVEKAIGSIMLILQWIRLMKFVRAYNALGPFVVILRHVISDTARFAFLFFEFYIPYAAAFWIMFGSSSVPGYSNVEELFYNLLQITVVGDYRYSDISKEDGRMARLLCGTYIVFSGIVCLNLFIALLSDTFQRVYDNARANAQMLRAATTLYIEDNLAQRKRDKFKIRLQMKCSPETMYYDDDMIDESDLELKRMTQQIKQDLDKLKKYLEGKFGNSSYDGVSINNRHHGDDKGRWTNDGKIRKLELSIEEMVKDHENSMKMINIQLLSMNSMLTELSNRKKRSQKRKDKKIVHSLNPFDEHSLSKTKP